MVVSLESLSETLKKHNNNNPKRSSNLVLSVWESLDLELAFTRGIEVFTERVFYGQGTNWGLGFGARHGKTSKPNLSFSL